MQSPYIDKHCVLHIFCIYIDINITTCPSSQNHTFLYIFTGTHTHLIYECICISPQQMYLYIGKDKIRRISVWLVTGRTSADAVVKD